MWHILACPARGWPSPRKHGNLQWARRASVKPDRSRVSLVFALKAEGEKHDINHTIDNGVIVVDKASLFVSPFLGTFLSH
jgi:hypothetical protein